MFLMTSVPLKRNVLTGVLLVLSVSAAFANPVGGVVSNGSATINTDGAGTLTITQTSTAATINWQSFSIEANEAVRFVQPGSSSVALNRVLGSDPSRILGNLSANGQVFLINPNGILFGRNASVNVAGLVASTRDIADSDFLNGRLHWKGSQPGDVLNLGSIVALEGGYVALLGSSVTNQGQITAQRGSVALAAGNSVTLDFAGDGLLRVSVNEAALNAQVVNGGVIQAAGGAVWLSASAHDALLSTVIDNSGVIQANSVGERNGRIYLDGGAQGVVSVEGTLQAAGMVQGSTGGSITVTGDKVAVQEGAVLDATGEAGGGSIAVGGSWQGKDATVRQARAVYIAQNALLDASAMSTGNGGTIVAWSDIRNAQSATRVYGTLRAKGGAQSGDGGHIETSGHWLDIRGIRLDASAAHGKAGLWLLDPEDLTVSSAPTTAMPPGGPMFMSGPGASNVDNATINALLDSGTSVMLQTAPTGTGNGDITIAADITKTAGTDATLTLMAHGAIVVNPGINITSSAGMLNLDLLAGGAITLGAGSTLSSNGGDIVLAGSRLVNNAGANVLNTAGGRWLVYTASPLDNALGGLSSANPAIWSQDPGTLPPPSVAPGNWFVYQSADPTTGVTTAIGTMQSTLGAPRVVPPDQTASAADWTLEPPGWLAIGPEGFGEFLTGTSVPGTGLPMLASNTTLSPQTSPAPPVSRLRSSGFVGVQKPLPPATSANPASPQVEAFLRGSSKAFQAGTSSNGAALVARLNPPGSTPGMAVSVNAGEGFQITLPQDLLRILRAQGRMPTLQARVGGSSLPTWLALERTTPGLSARSVPDGALPVTVRLIGSNGKSIEVVLQ
jgi:filamentous hemagglutinin family protein